MKPLLHWFVAKGFIAACFYFGITGHNGLEQLAQALLWIGFLFLFAIACLCLQDTASAKELREKLRTKRDGQWRMPYSINLIYDLTLAAYIAYHSDVFTALVIFAVRFVAGVLKVKINEEKIEGEVITPPSFTKGQPH